MWQLKDSEQQLWQLHARQDRSTAESNEIRRSTVRGTAPIHTNPHHSEYQKGRKAVPAPARCPKRKIFTATWKELMLKRLHLSQVPISPSCCWALKRWRAWWPSSTPNACKRMSCEQRRGPKTRHRRGAGAQDQVNTDHAPG